MHFNKGRGHFHGDGREIETLVLQQGKGLGSASAQRHTVIFGSGSRLGSFRMTGDRRH